MHTILAAILGGVITLTMITIYSIEGHDNKGSMIVGLFLGLIIMILAYQL